MDNMTNIPPSLDIYLMLKETQVLLHHPKCVLVIKLSMFFDGKIPHVGCLQFLFWCLKPQCFSINMFVHEIPILAVEIC